MTTQDWRLETIAVQAGYTPENGGQIGRAHV